MANILTSDPLLSYSLHYQPSKEWPTSLGSSRLTFPNVPWISPQKVLWWRISETSSEGHIFLLNPTGASNDRIYQWEMLQCVFLFPPFFGSHLKSASKYHLHKAPSKYHLRKTPHTYHIPPLPPLTVRSASTQDEGAAFVLEVSILQGEITHTLDTDGPGVQFRIAASSQSDLGHGLGPFQAQFPHL